MGVIPQILLIPDVVPAAVGHVDKVQVVGVDVGRGGEDNEAAVDVRGVVWVVVAFGAGGVGEEGVVALLGVACEEVGGWEGQLVGLVCAAPCAWGLRFCGWVVEDGVHVCEEERVGVHVAEAVVVAPEGEDVDLGEEVSMGKRAVQGESVAYLCQHVFVSEIPR